MSEDPRQTGLTDPPDDAEPGDDTPAGGTPEGAEPDADKGKEPDYKAIHLANKETIAELKAEMAEMRERERAGSSPAPGREAHAQQDIDARDARMAELRRLAPSDPASAAALDLLEEVQQMRRDTADAMTLQRVPAEKQGPVLDYYEKYRARAGWNSLSQCLQYIEGREAKTDAATLRKRVAELETALKSGSKVDADDVVRTRGQDLPATKGKAIVMSEADWRAEQARLTDEGRHEERRARQRQLREREIVLKR